MSQPQHSPWSLRGLWGNHTSLCDLLPASPFPLLHVATSLSPSPPCSGSPLWLHLSSSVPPGDRNNPEGKAKSAKSTKKEPMSMFQVNGEKKEKKSKKKGMG